MRRTYTLNNRVIAVLLCIAMVISYMPGMILTASAADPANKVVDPSTINDWKALFGPGVLSTEFAGGVWTDKSVFQSMDAYLQALGVSQLQGPTAPITSQVRDMLDTDPENFLVALSAIAANQQITGYTTVPTDTILVLDVSQSMDNQGYVPDMITAANTTIKTLMDSNPNNRVGVVLFSGSNSQQSNQGTGSATVLLPLDHYTATNAQNPYLRYTGTSSNTTVYIATGLRDGNGDTVSSNTGKTTAGGTYTQNGLYKAWGEFSKLTSDDILVPAGQPQAGTKRIPAIVLMSDGQPTVGDTTYYDIGSSTIGDGTSPNETEGDRMSFLTQLTAAWVKAKVADKYDMALEDVRFYTLGLNTSTNRYATDVLNPATSQNDRLANYWSSFISATPNNRGQVTVRNGWNDTYTIYKSTDGMITSAAQRVYPTQYFAANDTAKLAEAFATIAGELTAGIPYVTLVSDGEANLDGYITFEDQLGSMMEVKSVKGLVMGDRVYTGAELAKSMNEGDLGSSSNPQDYGNEFVRTVKERLGITDTTIAQNLIRNAYHSGQLSYTSATEYSNYIGWYADADGNYLGFWQESYGYGSEGAPEGAAYINRSYGYLGAESSEPGASDMMHVVVMVHTEIATGDVSIIYKIPASLIPMVVYNVELEGTDPSQPTSITREDAFPLQLLAEVGLRSDINAVNLEQKVAQYVENGGHAHKNADGIYSFYTNRWGSGDGHTDVDYDEPLSHMVAQSHFHPAADNSRYYFTEDTLICTDQNGTAYNGITAPSGTGYYHARSFYTATNGEARVTTVYLPVSAVSLAQAVRGDDNHWYIPAGIPFQETERFRVSKVENPTGTLNYSDHPAVLHNQDGYNVYAFLGNNGKLTMEPAQGIALTKTIAELSEDANAPTEFTFRVTLSQAVAAPVVTDTDGAPIDNSKWSVSGTVITVKLAADETVVITGIPTGVTYTVEEETTGYYVASSANASGVVEAYMIKNVDFVNTARGYGSLVVGKDVNYPEGFVPGTAHNSKEFTIEVSFTGDITGIVTPAGAVRSGNAFTLKLKDGESVTFTNIPEGVTYTVSEGAMPAGYTLQETRYSDDAKVIAAHDVDEVEVVNRYTLQPVSPNVKVRGIKTLITNEATWGGESFTVELFRIDNFADQDPVSTGLTATMTEADKDYEIDLNGIVLDHAGTYYFRAVEVVSENRNPNIAYDRTYGLFSVTVGDANADGALEVQDVRAYQNTGITGNATNGWVIEKDFTNMVTTDRIYLDIQKNVVDADNNTPVNAHRGDITFGLFADTNAGTAPAYYMLTDTAGKATIMVPVTQQIIEDASGSIVYYLREIAPAPENRVVGMHYDESWLYAIEITWDAQGNTAVVRYAPIENGVVGTYQAYVEGTTVFNHTNTYEEGVNVALQLSGDKTINGGNDLGGREFSFSLYESTAAFVQGRLIETVENNGNAITFGEVTFTAPGVYYMVARENASNLGGITIDRAIYHITVEVEKFVDTDGTTRLRLVSGYPAVVKYGTSVNVGADGLDFNNIYTITGAQQLTLRGHKELQGRALTAGEFEFGLYEGTALLHKVSNLGNGNFTFPTITYEADDIGIYTYTIKEIIPTEKLGGVTYDTTEYIVDVTVSDNMEGGLELTQSVRNNPNGRILFTNLYETEPVDVTLTGTKTLFNQDMGSYVTLAGGEFTFYLYNANQGFTTQGALAVPAVTNGANGTISITLNDLTAGDYYYILREELGNAAGMHYDTSVFNVRVLVSDNGNGTLSPTVTINKVGNGATSIAFGNIYTPEPVEHAITGTKNLTGRDIISGEFTFELYDAAGELLQTAENVGNAFAFQPIEYEKSGTYTYTVKERIPEQAENGVYKGVTYDPAVYTVTVTVSDNNGALQAVSSHTATQLVFSNAYDGADTHFTVSGLKELTDKTLEAGMFSFAMYDKNGVHIATVENAADGTFTFLNIPLVSAGEFTYTIREVIPAGAELEDGVWVYRGITYSSAEFTVKVNVTDPGGGQLVASEPVIVNGPVKFTNTYKVDPIQVTIRGTKVLLGDRTTMGNNEFSFVLSGNSIQRQAGNRADGTITFDPIEFAAAGNYTFTVQEENAGKNGMTYDGNPYEITVEVTDNGDGTLSAEVIYPDGGLTFTNTYTVSGETSFTVEGEKHLVGRDFNSGDHFEFELKDSQGVLQTVPAVDGVFTITQNLSTLGVHTFTLTEKAPEGGVKDGVTYSKRVYTITVNVSDNGEGGLVAGVPVITIGGVDVAKATFVNTYAASGEVPVTLGGTKKLNNRDLVEGEFEFELYHADASWTLGDKITQSAPVKNGTAGIFTFDTITYTEAGSHYYVIKEVIPENAFWDAAKNAFVLDGVVYDGTQYLVCVEILDNQLGGLYEKVSIRTEEDPNANTVIFNNTYVVEGTVPLQLEGIKHLTGKKLLAGEFTFELYEGDTLAATASNDSQGNFLFEGVTFSDIGEYVFTAVEKNGEVLGMIYDQREYTVKVVVADNGVGGLKIESTEVTLNGEPAELVFENTYNAAKVTVDLGVVKTVQSLATQTIGPEGFKFLLADETGKELSTVETDKDGNAGFTVTYTAADIGKTYNYTISEVDTGKDFVTYSKDKYTVQITVTQTDNGVLVPTVTLDGKQVEKAVVTFVNVYAPTTTPQTGDSFHAGLFISLMVLSSFGLAALIVGKKREESEETAE